MLRVFVYLQTLLAQPLTRDDRGATAVEYGLIVALIAAVIIGVVTVLGTRIHAAFCTVSTGLGGTCP